MSHNPTGLHGIAILYFTFVICLNTRDMLHFYDPGKYMSKDAEKVT
jgi:hypothetical protein